MNSSYSAQEEIELFNTFENHTVYTGAQAKELV